MTPTIYARVRRGVFLFTINNRRPSRSDSLRSRRSKHKPVDSPRYGEFYSRWKKSSLLLATVTFLVRSTAILLAGMESSLLSFSFYGALVLGKQRKLRLRKMFRSAILLLALRWKALLWMLNSVGTEEWRKIVIGKHLGKCFVFYTFKCPILKIISSLILCWGFVEMFRIAILFGRVYNFEGRYEMFGSVNKE